MIRHAGLLFTGRALPPGPILPLAVAMIEPPFGTALMTLIGAPPLFAAGALTAGLAAIAMPPVAVRTQEKGRQAIRAKAGPLPQYRFVRRHAASRRIAPRHPFRVR